MLQDSDAGSGMATWRSLARGDSAASVNTWYSYPSIAVPIAGAQSTMGHMLVRTGARTSIVVKVLCCMSRLLLIT